MNNWSARFSGLPGEASSSILLLGAAVVALVWANSPLSKLFQDLGDIGFTMSHFIMGMSFTEDTLMIQAKLGILFGALASAVLGLAFLWSVSLQKKDPG